MTTVQEINKFIQENADKLDVNSISDGHHTFNELYAFRQVYNMLLFNEWAKQGKYDIHKSKKHHDGEDCFGGGWFIVVAMLPTGQITNHYKLANWNMFKVPEEPKAKYEFDNHNGMDSVTRMFALNNDNKEHGKKYSVWTSNGDQLEAIWVGELGEQYKGKDVPVDNFVIYNDLGMFILAGIVAWTLMEEPVQEEVEKDIETKNVDNESN